MLWSARKTSTLLRVNRTHSLARGLLDCYIFGPAGNHGLVRLGDPRSLGGYGGTHPGSFQAAPEPSIYMSNPGNVADPWFSIPNYTNYSAGDVGVFTRFIPHSFPNTVSWIFAKDGGGTAELGCSLDTSGNNNFAFLGSNSSIPSTLTTGYAVNVIGDYALTRTGTTVAAYANGAQIGTWTSSNTGAQAVSLALGRDNSLGTQNGDFQFFCFYTWSRGLTAAEVQQLHFDPYCFLVPVFDPAFTTFSGYVHYDWWHQGGPMLAT